ncbi:MAG TPA: aldehyde dehydrogenase family protein, partial [Saprospiraceae bacterium]|nr:aldehyde dehydrogenase family protein [Saprospiraceae bacterium]
MDIRSYLIQFGSDIVIHSYSPIDGNKIGEATITTTDQYALVMQSAEEAFTVWRKVPAPKRGDIIRQYGDKLREYKDALGHLVSYEMGKSLQEGLGEVQEMIDICDFAVGLSRQLYGLTMHSERPNHRMYEQWHPLGIVGIISAFNFPVAVWSWNAMIALVCGDVVIWKGSEKTPLCAIACQKLLAEIILENNLPSGISSIITGGIEVGQWLTQDERVALISATGSIPMGKAVAQVVGARLGKTLLELGGNNAIIITPHADLDLSTIAVTFGAVGTCGQRCTTTRRLIVHESLIDKVCERLVKAYGQLKIGNPLDAANHVGPLIDGEAVQSYLLAIETAKSQGANELVEGG